jgi:hypothetical protein
MVETAYDPYGQSDIGSRALGGEYIDSMNFYWFDPVTETTGSTTEGWSRVPDSVKPYTYINPTNRNNARNKFYEMGGSFGSPIGNDGTSVGGGILSGLNYARSIAGGENVPSMIAPGVGYSEEFPMGYTMEGGVPSAVAPPVAPPPPMQPIAEEPMFTRAPPAITGRVPDPRDLPSPTGIPYIDELNYRLATPPEGGLLITPEEEMAAAQVRALGLGQFTPPVFGSGLPMTDGEMAMFDLDPEGYEFATPPAMPAPSCIIALAKASLLASSLVLP